jgi:hypothetical protein
MLDVVEHCASPYSQMGLEELKYGAQMASENMCWEEEGKKQGGRIHQCH